MALYIDENGTISLVQGDSGEIVVSGLDDKVSSNVYFAIQTLKRVPVASELMVQSNYSDTVTFVLTSAFTDLLTVPKNKEFETYQYASAKRFLNSSISGFNEYSTNPETLREILNSKPAYAALADL